MTEEGPGPIPYNAIQGRRDYCIVSPDEAMRRLGAILNDKLLKFNPYSVSDQALLDCAERGYWLPFPAITQMMVFHFHDIQRVSTTNGRSLYDGLFYHIGNTETKCHFGSFTLTHAMTHRATRGQTWTLIDGKHLVPSKLRSLQGKSVFVSHTICCDNQWGGVRQAYRMHTLRGTTEKRARTIRKSMCAAKIEMLQEMLRYPFLSEFLGNSCQNIDIANPIQRVINAIRNFGNPS